MYPFHRKDARRTGRPVQIIVASALREYNKHVRRSMNRIFRISGALCAALACILLVPAMVAHSEGGYPSRQIRLIVPYAPGGSNDVFARILARGLADKLGKPVIVENKPGAGGSIGGVYVAQSTPDGYTLLMVHNGLTIAPWIQKNLGYDPLKMEPILIGTKLPMVVTVDTDLPVRSIKELIAHAKSNPGKLSYAIPGIGTPHHLAGELFMKMAGIDMVAIPYKGTTEIVSDLKVGRVNVLFSAIDTMRPYILAGDIRVIAVADEKPLQLPNLPTVPTVNEALPGFEVSFWLGVMAPAGTPRPIIETLAREMAAVLEVPEMTQRLGTTGMVVNVVPLEKMRAVIEADYERWGRVIESAGIVAN